MRYLIGFGAGVELLLLHVHSFLGVWGFQSIFSLSLSLPKWVLLVHSLLYITLLVSSGS